MVYLINKRARKSESRPGLIVFIAIFRENCSSLTTRLTLSCRTQQSTENGTYYSIDKDKTAMSPMTSILSKFEEMDWLKTNLIEINKELKTLLNNIFI